MTRRGMTEVPGSGASVPAPIFEGIPGPKLLDVVVLTPRMRGTPLPTPESHKPGPSFGEAPQSEDSRASGRSAAST